jgi:hypothetical protein
MRTLHNALRWLHLKKKSMDARMRRVSLGMVVYLIWEERNRRVFEGKTRGVNTAFRRFQVLFYIIFHFHEKDHSLFHVGLWELQWSWEVFPNLLLYLGGSGSMFVVRGFKSMSLVFLFYAD